MLRSVHGKRRPKRAVTPRLWVDALEARTLLSLTVPAYSSRPSAPASLYLDFDGDPGGPWNGPNDSFTVSNTPAFSIDGNANDFGAGDLAAIQEVWQRVAEKYSPFNLNVTTVDPGTYADRVAFRIVIGGNGAWFGGNAGGVTYQGSFSSADAPNTGWVFSRNLEDAETNIITAKNVAEAVAHEAAHGFGAYHQSLYNGAVKQEEYHPGDALRAPIMGVSYAAARGVWWNGQTSQGHTFFQDDMAVIANTFTNGFGYRLDDHAPFAASSTALGVNGSNYSGAGVIETIFDVDMFKFTLAGAAHVNFSLNVPAAGAMLDGKLRLLDSSGTLIVEANTASLGETISRDLGAGGTYYLAVASRGLVGDVGSYTLAGDSSPLATPNPPSNLAATAVAGNTINLTWADNSGNETGFKIQVIEDGGIAWLDLTTRPANSTSYAYTFGEPGKLYYFRVYAYIGIVNSGFSNQAGARNWGGGDGLVGVYYNNTSLTSAANSRIDPTINLNFGTNAPAGGISPNSYSVQWTGEIQSTQSGLHTFFTTADDGVRLYVNDVLIVDRWSSASIAGDANGDGVVNSADFNIVFANMNQSGTWEHGDFDGDGKVTFGDYQRLSRNWLLTGGGAVSNSGTMNMVAGQRYSITLEYFQNSGNGSIHLEWKTPAGARETVPQDNLFSQGSLFAPVPAEMPVAAAEPAPLAAPAPAVTAAKKPQKKVEAVFSVTPVVKAKAVVKRVGAKR